MRFLRYVTGYVYADTKRRNKGRTRNEEAGQTKKIWPEHLQIVPADTAPKQIFVLSTERKTYSRKAKKEMA